MLFFLMVYSSNSVAGWKISTWKISPKGSFVYHEPYNYYPTDNMLKRGFIIPLSFSKLQDWFCKVVKNDEKWISVRCLYKSSAIFETKTCIESACPRTATLSIGSDDIPLESELNISVTYE